LFLDTSTCKAEIKKMPAQGAGLRALERKISLILGPYALELEA
jgi:hypothetical protein